MEALALEAFDVPPAVIDVPEPEAGPGEVLVRVRTSSVNAFDVGVAAGFMKDDMDYTGNVAATIRERYPGGVDALIDAVDRDPGAFATLAGLARDGGRATSVVGGAGESAQIGEVAVSNTGGNPGHLLALAELVVQGKLHVAIRRTYALTDAGHALQDFSNEHTLGKLVITMT